MPAIDLIGQRFSRLVVVSRLANTKHGATRWGCLCDCGNTVPVAVSNLKSGHTRSCGCLHKESTTTHGLYDTPEYYTWINMKVRCYDTTNRNYHNYGGRGILVCAEWKDDFEAFYKDMGPRPSRDHSLERRENDKGYCKSNCKWATQLEQSNNRRTNVLIEFDGETKTLTEWCRELNVNYRKVKWQLEKGLPFEDAVNAVIKKVRHGET